MAGTVVVNDPEGRPPVYIHLPKLLFESPALNSPTQSFAALPVGAVQFTVTLAPAFTDDAATERLYVATGPIAGMGVGVTVGVGVGVSVGAEDGVEAAAVTVMALDRATSVYPSFCRKRNSYVPGVGGAVVTNVPDGTPPVYTHFPPMKLLLESPTL